jgi:hypothetical protein
MVGGIIFVEMDLVNLIKITGLTVTVKIATKIIDVLTASVIKPNFKPIAEAAIIRDNLEDIRKPAPIEFLNENFKLNNNVEISFIR